MKKTVKEYAVFEVVRTFTGSVAFHAIGINIQCVLRRKAVILTVPCLIRGVLQETFNQRGRNREHATGKRKTEACGRAFGKRAALL